MRRTERWLDDVSATFNVVPMDAAAFRETP